MVLIPRIMHTIWVGPHQMSDRNKKILELKKMLFPCWNHRLWTDKEVSRLKIQNIEFYNRSSVYAQKADILRLELLFLFGGIYADADVEFFRTFDNMLGGTGFICQGLGGRKFRHTNCLMGSTKGNLFVKNMIDALPRSYIENRRIVWQTGPGFITRKVDGWKNKGDIKTIPPECLHKPNAEWEIQRYTRASFIRNNPKMIGVHYSDHAW